MKKVYGIFMGIYTLAILVLATNMYRINMWAARFDMVNRTERGLRVYRTCKMLVAEWPAIMLILMVMYAVLHFSGKLTAK